MQVFSQGQDGEVVVRSLMVVSIDHENAYLCSVELRRRLPVDNRPKATMFLYLHNILFL